MIYLAQKYQERVRNIGSTSERCSYSVLKGCYTSALWRFTTINTTNSKVPLSALCIQTDSVCCLSLLSWAAVFLFIKENLELHPLSVSIHISSWVVKAGDGWTGVPPFRVKCKTLCCDTSTAFLQRILVTVVRSGAMIYMCWWRSVGACTGVVGVPTVRLWLAGCVWTPFEIG